MFIEKILTVTLHECIKARLPSSVTNFNKHIIKHFAALHVSALGDPLQEN
jgi:hypothetical protein